jgi:hypothetical protein
VTMLHVSLLRRLAAGERIPAEWRTRAETEAGLDALVLAGLARWDAGFGSDGQGGWVPLREPGHTVTPAGRAALLFYELGRVAHQGA